MSATESRIRNLIAEHMDLDHDPDFDRAFGEAGVSSMDCLAFVKLVSKEFDVTIAPEDWGGFGNLRGLVAHIDASAG